MTKEDRSSQQKVNDPYAVCIGTCAVDHIFTGVESRPAFGQSVDATGYAMLPGGMGLNVSRCLQKLGYNSVLFSWINESDGPGQFLKSKIEEYKDDSHTDSKFYDHILKVNNNKYKTQVCASFVDRGLFHERGFIFYPSANQPVEELARSIRDSQEILRNASIIHLAGIGGGGIYDSSDFVNLLNEITTNHNGNPPIITADAVLNSNITQDNWLATNLRLVSAINYFFLADHELDAITKGVEEFPGIKHLDWELSQKIKMRSLDWSSKNNISEAVGIARGRLGLKESTEVIVKLGGYGVFRIHEKNTKGEYYAAELHPHRGEFETTGAGDALCAGFIAGKMHSPRLNTQTIIRVAIYIAHSSLCGNGAHSAIPSYKQALEKKHQS